MHAGQTCLSSVTLEDDVSVQDLALPQDRLYNLPWRENQDLFTPGDHGGRDKAVFETCRSWILFWPQTSSQNPSLILQKAQHFDEMWHMKIPTRLLNSTLEQQLFSDFLTNQACTITCLHLLRHRACRSAVHTAGETTTP